MQEGSLKDKTVKGVTWSGIDNVARLGSNFIISIILARLLSPENYGLIGYVSIITTICTALVDGGFINALIRKNQISDKDYNTVFICNLSSSILLYGVIVISAPLIALFFNEAELTVLLRVASLVLVLNSLSLVQQARLIKRIDFKTQTKISIVCSVSSGCLGILMALMGLGVWALVGQLLLGAFLKMSLLWYFNKWFPSFSFDKNSFSELFGFGWKMMLSSLLDTTWKELNQLIVGKYYKAYTLGQYTRANQFSQLFSSNLTSVIQRVTYPVLSSIQDDKARMISAYRRIIKITMYLAFSSMFLLAAVSSPLIYCLLGPKWNEAAVYLPYLCAIGSLYPLHAINLNMLKVQGRSDLFLKLEIVKKIIYVIPLLIGAFVGIIPMLVASIVAEIINYFLNSYFTGVFLQYSSWMQLQDIFPSLLVAVLVAIPVYFCHYLPLSNWVVLVFQAILGAALLVLFSRIFKIREYEEVKSLVLSYFKK